MILIGEKIKLRNLKDSDWKSIFENANNRKVSKYTDIPYPFTVPEIKKYVRKLIKEFKTRKSFHFGVEIKEEKGIVGIFSLENINYKNKSAELTFWLSSKYWGENNIASNALKIILLSAFKKIKLNRIYARTLPQNIASIKFLKKNNFVCEGRLRKMLFEKGKFNDVLVFSILKEEFKKIKQ